mmetsp:Transcript_13348/g.24544  ORF Transcript_13348/g.24544 Transcript_13348/m.24544 type:complete len:173 (+) Transcript_13348:166-684(+)
MSINTLNPLDFAIRVCESTAFFLHGVLGITEPFTGCLRGAFQDKGASGGMPSWSWPMAGVLLLVVAAANFSNNNTVVLAAQAYIAAFHAGAVFYHLILGHHPASGCAPAVFIVMAFIVTWLRTNVLVAVMGTFACTAIAAGLSKILVTPPAPLDGDEVGSASQSHLLHQTIQ